MHIGIWSINYIDLRPEKNPQALFCNRVLGITYYQLSRRYVNENTYFNVTYILTADYFPMNEIREEPGLDSSILEIVGDNPVHKSRASRIKTIKENFNKNKWYCCC